MTDKHPDSPPDDALPEALVDRRSRISLIWLIPLVAALIGAWLAWKTYTEAGPTITIHFASADGLEAGKTKLRYKNVEIGEVESIELSEDLDGVVVGATLVKDATRFLTAKTRFWVVKARVSASEVSGLGTLLGGAYIGIDPVLDGEPAFEFQGLAVPPVVTTDQPGEHFYLNARELRSVQVGSPVYFRDIQVGEVVSYQLEADTNALSIQIFVRAPHHQRVTTNTRFWNASGLNVSLGASGVAVDTPSLTSLLVGGIAFGSPPRETTGERADPGSHFSLHANRQEAFEQRGPSRSRWLLNFSGSVRGLAVGAPVEFRGIPLGEVVDIHLEMNLDRVAFRIPVLIEIAPERLRISGSAQALIQGQDSQQSDRQLWDSLVAGGLRAQLKTGNLLTGALFIDLDLHDNARPRGVNWDTEPYPELPTIPTPLEELRNALTAALEKFEQMSFEQMGSDLEESLAALRQTSQEIQTLSASLNNSVIPGLNATLSQTRQTLAVAEGTLSTAGRSLAPDSSLQREAQQVLRELAAAARSLRTLADYLERHPEALIQGK